MKRVPADTDSVDLDRHGTGKHGHRDPNLPTYNGTVVDERWLEAVQEELALAVELFSVLSGAVSDGSGDTFLQLREAFLRTRTHGLGGLKSWRSEGSTAVPFVPTFTTGLIGTNTGGRAYINGRIVDLDSARVAAVEPTKTYTASKDTYVHLHQDGLSAATPYLYTEVDNGDPVPAEIADYGIVAKVVTDATDITAATSHLSENPIFTRAPTLHTASGAQHSQAAPAYRQHIGAVSGAMDGDALYGPRTVYTTTNTNGTENESLGYSVPDGKIIEVIVEAHGCRDNDASNRYRCLIRKMFFSVSGTITADLSTDVNEFNNGFGAAGDVTGVTLIESGGLLLLAITSTTTNTIRHAINFYVRELSHTET